MGLFVVAVGLAMIGVGLAGRLPGATGVLISFAGVIVALIGVVLSLMSFYRRTTADQAFVRTGLGKSRVVLDGGTMVFPGLHKVLEINLRTMKLGVNPRGANALITRDNLRANVLAQFYIRVQADEEHILSAARSLGESSVNAEAVEQLVSEKLVSALRAIASQMDLFEIHTKRDEFAEKVKEHVRSDLESNGLLLESVTISELDQTDPSELSDNNVFDAQGKRKITEITAAAAVERNNLERAAEQARKQQDVEARQKILAYERQQAEAEALQEMEVARYRAEREREAKEALISQERQVELARIEKEKQVQTQELARQQEIETLRVKQEQAVQAAEIAREQQLSVAERQKEITVAEQEAIRARAEREALEAKAERERASQAVVTVTQMAEADREAQKRLIAARQEIEQDKLRQQTGADVEAYGRLKQAEADREAAEQQAQARLQLAEAEAEAKERVARGDKAQQMIAVEVAREQVAVEQAKVEVERQQMENRQQFAEAGIQLEIQKLTISASRDVQIEFAKAIAGFLSSGHMTLYGTPETASSMLENMAKGMGLRSTVEGFLAGTNGDKDDRVGALLSQLGSLLQPEQLAAVKTALAPKPTPPASS